MMWEMIFREFERHKLRTALTMLGVTIGIFLVTSVSSFSEGIIYYVDDQLAITSGLVMVTESEIPTYMVQRSEIDQMLVEELSSIGGVEEVAPILFYTSNGFSITGTEKQSQEIIRGVNIEVEEGREYDEDSYEIVLGHDFAADNDYVIGDSIEVDGKELEIVGVLEDSGDQDIDNSVQMPLATLQEIAGMEDRISIIMVKPLSAEDAETIEQAINDEFDEIKAASDKSLMENTGEMLSQLNTMTFALGSIAALISGIVIMNVMIISVRERRREIGTMKAVGATNYQVLASVLLEAVMISVGGAIIGVLLSFGGAAFLNTVLPREIAIVTPRLVLQGIVFAAFIGIVSGILPARQAAKLNPIEAIRYE